MAGALNMKFNPYPVLLTTAALMFAIVAFALTGTTATLVKAGAVSVDRDFVSFAAKTRSSLEGGVLVADEPPGADVAHHPDSRLAVDDTVTKGAKE